MQGANFVRLRTFPAYPSKSVLIAENRHNFAARRAILGDLVRFYVSHFIRTLYNK